MGWEARMAWEDSPVKHLRGFIRAVVPDGSPTRFARELAVASRGSALPATINGALGLRADYLGRDDSPGAGLLPRLAAKQLAFARLIAPYFDRYGEEIVL